MSELPKYALTLWSPWPQIIVHGTKRTENRTWKPHRKVWGQRIAIHCGKSLDQDVLEAIAKDSPSTPYGQYGHWIRQEAIRVGRDTATVGERMYPGCIVGTAMVAGVRKGDDVKMFKGQAPATPEEIADPWYIGAPFYGWILRDVREVEPIKHRGAQGLWTIDGSVRGQIREVAP